MTRLLTLVLAATLLQAAPALAKSKHCPPGLAKKSPACVPPGQAKKGVTSEDWKQQRGQEDVSRDNYDDRYDDRGVAILRDGDIVRIDGNDYVVIDTRYGPILRRNDELFRLPRYDDSEYVRIGDALVRVDRDTKNVIDWIRLTHLILS